MYYNLYNMVLLFVTIFLDFGKKVTKIIFNFCKLKVVIEVK